MSNTETVYQPEKEVIPGVILIISCNKHKETRLKKFKLSKTEYGGWKVFIIIGNPFLENDYEINDNIITIKCEDSYIHLLKKVVLSCKILFNLYDIQEGILRCGDDLVFNEDRLENFLINQPKTDYMGVVPINIDTITPSKNTFMTDYFASHPDDITNPINGINYSNEVMSIFNIIPKCTYVSGVILYISKYTCQLLIKYMELINWNIFMLHNKVGFPFIIEDVGIGYILTTHNIMPSYYPFYTDKIELFKTNNYVITFHTNEDK